MKIMTQLAAVFLLMFVVGLAEAQPAELTSNTLRGVEQLSTASQCEPTTARSIDSEIEYSSIANATCLMCGSGSTGSCARRSGKARVQCRGSRKDCKARGCAISGTASCSSAGNVQSC